MLIQANSKGQLALASQVLTATGTGASVSNEGQHGVLHQFNVGNSADTLSGSVYWTLTIEDSPNNSDWTTVTDSGAIVDSTGSAYDSSTGAVAVIDAPAEDTLLVECHYIGAQPYSRAVITKTGTHSSGTPVGIIATKSHLRKQP